MKSALLLAAFALQSLAAGTAHAQAPQAALTIVAAEDFYGNVARRLAGPDATITSILHSPDQDPHLFEASPSVARSLSRARIVVYNGLDYDPWMPRLLEAAKAPDRRVVVVADVLHRKTGDNPHLWYAPANMAAAARAMAAAMAATDPAGTAGYDQRLRAFLDSLGPVEARMALIRRLYPAAPVTATEPVFGPMAAALGLDMRNERFQLAVMNGTEPRVSDVAAFEADLRQHRVRVLFYNIQASDPAAKRLRDIAEAAGIPVVGVTETEPGGTDYPAWMLRQLDDVDAALRHAP